MSNQISENKVDPRERTEQERLNQSDTEDVSTTEVKESDEDADLDDHEVTNENDVAEDED